MVVSESGTPSELGRMASALERIAAAQEVVARSSQTSRPAPDLQVRRAPTDQGAAGPVNLMLSDGQPEGILNVHIYNEGPVAATVESALLDIVGERVVGEFAVSSTDLAPKATVDPGAGRIVLFKVPSSIAGAERLGLTVRFRPSQWGIDAELVERLVSSGIRESRHTWESDKRYVRAATDA